MSAKRCGSICAAQPVTMIPRLRALTLELADGLCRLAHGLCRDGTCVDDDRVAEPGRVAWPRITSELVGVEAAAHGHDTDPARPSLGLRSGPMPDWRSQIALILGCHGSAISSASSTPSCSSSTGPVIRMRSSAVHSISKWSAWQRHSDLPAREPLARCAHRRCTGGTAARLGEAGAALPGPHSDGHRRR